MELGLDDKTDIFTIMLFMMIRPEAGGAHELLCTRLLLQYVCDIYEANCTQHATLRRFWDNNTAENLHANYIQ